MGGWGVGRVGGLGGLGGIGRVGGDWEGWEGWGGIGRVGRVGGLGGGFGREELDDFASHTPLNKLSALVAVRFQASWHFGGVITLLQIADFGMCTFVLRHS